MKPQLPKPANKQQYLRAVEALENRHTDVLTASVAFREHVEEIWSVSDLSEKELLALIKALKSKRETAFVVAL